MKLLRTILIVDIQGAPEPRLGSILRALSQALRNPPGTSPDRLPIRVGERTRFLELSRITHFFTQGRLTFAASEGKSHCVEWTITGLEQKLAGPRFFRIHRETLVNLEWLDETHTLVYRAYGRAAQRRTTDGTNRGARSRPRSQRAPRALAIAGGGGQIGN